MPTGLSLHIGLNSVDPHQYGGWSGNLKGCENDARDMAAIADSCGFKHSILLTSEATSEALLTAMDDAALQLKTGDIFLLTYSGHGGQVDDTNGDEPDGLDETWVLFDRQVIDDELFAKYTNFEKGVRIFVLSDSCHSGTVNRALVDEIAQVEMRASMRPSVPENYKFMPEDIQFRDGYKRKELYASIQEKAGLSENSHLAATVLLISGCQDSQYSADGARNGLFTEKLLRVWNHGAFHGGYRKFYDEICKKMPPSQTPNLSIIGAQDAFKWQTPFTIAEAHAVAAV
jgi:hypothetical protein